MCNDNIQSMQSLYLQAQRIQNKYSFEIPHYILEEIAEQRNDKVNLLFLINMAVINNRFSDKEADVLKRDFCF